jgi:ribosome maturation factor RimP
VSLITQDEELVVTERSRGLPSPPEVLELLDGDFTRAGYEIDSVRIDMATQPPRITVVADGDTAPDLETIAELSRIASERLDGLPDIVDGYVLEVTSPGVDRPLTAEKHFRRARGRKVELTLSDGSRVTGRIAGVDAGLLRLVIRANARSPWSVREIAFDDVAEAVVQVEFSPPSPSELALVGQPAGNAGTEA